jgi:hypothetical protein
MLTRTPHISHLALGGEESATIFLTAAQVLALQVIHKAKPGDTLALEANGEIAGAITVTSWNGGKYAITVISAEGQIHHE